MAPSKVPVAPWDVKAWLDPVAEKLGDPTDIGVRKQLGVVCARYQNNYPYFSSPPARVTPSTLQSALHVEKQGVASMHGRSPTYKAIKVLKLTTILLMLTTIVVVGVYGNTKTTRSVALAASVVEMTVYTLLGGILVAYFYPRSFYPIYTKTDYTFVFISGILLVVNALLKIKPTINNYEDTDNTDTKNS